MTPSTHEAQSTHGDIDWSTKFSAYQCKELRDFIASRPHTIATHLNAHAIQEEYIRTVTDWMQSDDNTHIRGLDKFPYVYMTSGISSMIDLLSSFETRRVAIHKNEYSRYRAGIMSHNGTIVDVTHTSPDDCLTITSQPFSQMGSVDIRASSLIQSSKHVWIDAAYFGTNNHFKMVVPDNVETVVYSFSKSLGLQYSRIGIVFLREPSEGLEIGKKFAYHNLAAGSLVTDIIKEFSPSYFPTKMLPYQLQVCEEQGFDPIDCVWGAYDRKKGRKVSLFPYYEQMHL